MKLNSRSVLLILLISIICVRADFQFGRVSLTDGDWVSTTLIIPSQPYFLIMTSTSGPQNGFNLQLYNFSTLSMLAPNPTAQPTLVVDYLERELNLKPPFQPQMEWIDGTTTFIVASYIRDDTYQCTLRIYNTSINYDQITLIQTMNCVEAYPVDIPQIIFKHRLTEIMFIDYSVGQYVIQRNDFTGNIGSSHSIADYKFFICPIFDSNTYIYSDYNDIMNRMYVKDLNQAVTVNVYTVNLRAPIQMGQHILGTTRVAILHRNQLIVVYDYTTGNVQKEIFHEIQFTNLEYFQYNRNKGRLIIASKISDQRVIKQLDLTQNAPIRKATIMSVADTHTYPYQFAIHLDTTQSLIFYQASKNQFSLTYIDDCEGGYKSTKTGSCQSCLIGCITCYNNLVCLSCDEGYYLKKDYTCDYDGMLEQEMAHQGTSQYFLDTGNSKDYYAIKSPNESFYDLYDLQANTWSTKTVTTTGKTLISSTLLPTSQQFLVIEQSGGVTYLTRKNFQDLTEATPIFTYPVIPLNIHPFVVDSFQHIVFTDTGVNNKFTVVGVNTPLSNSYTGLSFSFSTNATIKKFFSGTTSSNCGVAPNTNNLLLMIDGSLNTRVFCCEADSVYSPNCSHWSAQDFSVSADTEFIHISGSNNFLQFSKGSQIIRLKNIITGASATHLTATANIRALTIIGGTNYGAALMENAGVLIFLVSTGAITRTVYGQRYSIRDTSIANVIDDTDATIIYMSDPLASRMTVVTKINYVITKINGCGINGENTNAAGTCQFCNTACLKCFGTTSADCTVCAPTYFLEGTSCGTSCSISNFFGNAVTRKCQVCDFQCATCTGNSDFCVTCRGDRTPASICPCPAGLYDDGVSTNCIQCNADMTCITCNEEYCLTCVFNRSPNPVINVRNCLCPTTTTPPQVTHLWTLWCTTCTDAPFQAQLSNNHLQITINFGTVVNIPLFTAYPVTQYTYDLCAFIFPNAFLVKLGDEPKCSMSATGQILRVNLGYRPTVLSMVDQLSFNANVFQRPSCTLYFTTYPFVDIANPTTPGTPTVTLFGPTATEINPCADHLISITSYTNDGYRRLTNLVWSSTTTDTDVLSTLAAHVGREFVYFEGMTFKQSQSYDITLSFRNYYNTAGSTTFTLTTFTTSYGPHVRLRFTERPQLYVFDYNRFVAEIEYLDCSTGSIQSLYSDAGVFYNIVWQDILGGTVTDIQTATTDLNVLSYTFDPYTRTAGTTYSINLRATSSIGSITTSHLIQYQVLASPLVCYISGGNRFHQHGLQLDVVSQSRDLDVAVALQTTGLTYLWTCTDQGTGAGCLYANGSTLVNATNQNLASLSFGAGTLKQQSVLKFKLTVSKAGKVDCETEVFVTVGSLDLPVQQFVFDERLYVRGINTNQVIEYSVTLSSASVDPDDMVYQSSVLYYNVQEGIQQHRYRVFRFRVWDHHNAFTQVKRLVNYLVTLQDGAYYMPHQNQLHLAMNLPPQYDSLPALVVTPAAGNSLTTIFTINLQNWYSNAPAPSYRFSYFLSTQDLTDQVEKNNINFLNDKLLQDFSARPTLTTTLPTVKLVSGLYQLVLLCEVQNWRRAVTNVTRTVTITTNSLARQQLITLYETQYSTILGQRAKNRQVRELNVLVQDMAHQDRTGCTACSSEGGTCDTTLGVCVCKPQFYMRDCATNRVNYNNWGALKFKIYGTLEQLYDRVVSLEQKRQIMDSIATLMDDKDLGLFLNTTYLDAYLAGTRTKMSAMQTLIADYQTKSLFFTSDTDSSRELLALRRILISHLKVAEAHAYQVQSSIQNLTDTQKLQYQKDLVQLIKTSIARTLHLLLTVNEDELVLEGGLLHLEISTKSPRYVLQRVIDPPQSTDLLDKFSDDDSSVVESDGIFRIYDVIKIGYKENIFRIEPTFPYQGQTAAYTQDIDIYRSGVIDQEVTIAQNVRYYFPRLNDTEQEANICVSRSKSSDWTPDVWVNTICATNYATDGRVICTCPDLQPVSIINDIDCIYRDCRTIDFPFEWFVSLMMYILSTISGVFLYAAYKAYTLDRILLFKVDWVDPVQVEPVSDKESDQDLEVEEPEKQRDENQKKGNVFEYLQGSKRSRLKRNKKKKIDQIEDGDEVEAKQGRGKVQEVEIINYDLEEEDKPIEYEPKYVDVYTRMNVFEAAWRLHTVFSIYYFYHPNAKRMYRTLIWYTRQIFTIVICGLLYVDADLRLFYTALFATLTLNVFDVAQGIIKQLLVSNLILIVIVGVDITVALCAYFWYLVIISNGWTNIEIANNWAFTYLLTFAIDNLIQQPLLIMLKSAILNFAIGHGNILAKLIKFALIFLEEQIFFRDLLKTVLYQADNPAGAQLKGGTPNQPENQQLKQTEKEPVKILQLDQDDVRDEIVIPKKQQRVVRKNVQ